MDPGQPADSAVAAAHHWFGLVFAGDLRAAWPLTSIAYRKEIVTTWLTGLAMPTIFKGIDIPLALSVDDPTGSPLLWDAFTNRDHFTEAREWLEGFLFGSSSHPITPMREIVTLYAPGILETMASAHDAGKGVFFVTAPFVMEHTKDGWLFCGPT
jgi:hypothetical protein